MMKIGEKERMKIKKGGMKIKDEIYKTKKRSR